ncbi:MAG TPA: SIMPL domain-containing protein [Candidatus Saccharibacteria bacterium]|nr:SIMPL domain-containing protein [Candidatus Saccharibacteria bacterium]
MKDKVNISLSLIYKSVIIFLMLIIVVMLAVWMPWSRNSESRTISVSGESTIMAEPDRYIFSPNYEFKNKDESVSLNQQSEKSNEIITKLKGLGVKDSDIKNNSSGYSTGQMSPVSPDDDTIYNLSLTITVSDKDLAQKVQDYLLTTGPSGQVTPQPGFSESKRKELEDKARDEATKDARSKAEQIAKNTGAKLGKVQSIQDGGNLGQPVPLIYEDKSVSSSDSKQSLQIQPGENELRYTVSVSYYLR